MQLLIFATPPGDLSFGEPFGSLDTNAYHPWVSNIFGSIKNIAFGVNANRYPFASSLLQRLVPAEVKTKWAEHRDLSMRSLRKRLDAETDRPDFVDKMLHARGTKGGVCPLLLFFFFFISFFFFSLVLKC